MVAILEQKKDGEKIHNVYTCGGSLITPNVVLTGMIIKKLFQDCIYFKFLFTAAHCVFNNSADDFKLRLGEWDTQTTNELFQQKDYLVDEIIVHENFNRRNLENDVAIMILKETVPIREHINTICLPPENKIFDRNRCFATGNK